MWSLFMEGGGKEEKLWGERRGDLEKGGGRGGICDDGDMSQMHI